jgi:signal transduction histidine kinase
MYRLFEINKDEPISPSIYLRYSLEDDLGIAKKIVNGIENKFESFEEIMRIKFNGSYKTLRIKAAPLKNEKGEIEKMLGVDIDISQAQHAEGKIMELNRSLFATNRELNSMNTELKTFANVAANTYSETLRHLYINLEMIVTNDARNLSNSGRANLRRAQGAIQKMKLTTEDLISFSRLHEVGSKENNVDLNIILEKVVEEFRKQPGHSLIMINCDHLPLMNGYPLLLSLLFHHLMDNAIKFRKKDSDHRVNVTCKESINGNDIAHNAAEKNAQYYIISVEDNGIGFPQTESEKIFEMFYHLHDKSEYKGSGTGLALCKKIMEMHGGFITAEGIPGDGASFHCYFPTQG